MFRHALPLALLFAVVGLHPKASGQAPAQGPPCMRELISLRDDAEKRTLGLKAAIEHKATPQEVCAIARSIAAAEAKMVMYVQTNAGWCGLPDAAVQQMIANHDRTRLAVKRECAAAHVGAAMNSR